MKSAHILIVVLPALLVGACRGQPPTLHEGDDILGWAVEGSDGLSCDWFFFTSQLSAKDSRVHRLETPVFRTGDEWSPDGRWLVSLGQEGRLAITSLTTGSVTEPLLTESLRAIDVSWSPDSTRIVFETTSGILEWMDLEGAQSGADFIPDVHFLHDGEDPDWSPDGESIAFTWDGGQNPASPGDARLFILKIDQPEVARELTPTLGGCRDPDWSPAGGKIAVACNWDIYVMDIARGTYSNLTGLPAPDLDGWPIDEQPSWTPAGDRVAFLSDRSPGGGLLDICLSDARENAIYTVKPNGDDIRPATLMDRFEIHWYTWMRQPR